MELDDRQLVQRAQNGDRRAFEALVRKYQRRVFRLAYGLVKRPEDAMDIAQEAFVKVHKNLEGFKGDASFYTWLYRITRNLAIDHLRRQRGGDPVEYEDGMRREEEAGQELGLRTSSKTFSPVKDALDKELGGRLHAALGALSENHREILLLREVEGLSYEELAEALDIPKGTVMSRLFHARKKMQEALRPYLTDEELRTLAGAGGPREETG